jgi:hypothetical protein
MSDTETQPTARPSLEELDWSDAGSDSAPEQPSSQASDAEPSAAGPPSSTTPSLTDETARDSRGPIPYDRHEAVLTKARNDAARALEEERARQRETFGWVKPYIDAGLNQEQLTYLVQMGSKFAGDKRGFLDALADDPAVQEWAVARAAQQAKATQQDAKPQPDLVAPNGTLVYSDHQLEALLEWRDRQTQGKIDATLKPILTEREERIAREKADAEFSEAQGKAQAIFDRYKSLPNFRENMPAIRAKYVELLQQGIADVGYAYSLVVTPTLSDAGRTQAIADMKRAAHSGAMNPKSGAPSTPAKKARLEDYDWS